MFLHCKNDSELCYVSARIFGNLGMKCFSVVNSGIKNTPFKLNFLRSWDTGIFLYHFDYGGCYW